MLPHLLLLLATTFAPSPPDSLLTPYEKGNGNQSTNYYECISWYEKLAKSFDECKLITMGNTAVGKPLHLLIIDKDKQFDAAKAHQNNKCILLVENGIHPGEPDGIDASMMLARDILTKPEYKKLLDHCVILIIPAYNISGVLNRSKYNRSTQNGPEESGFRGNRQNFDLNRDFVKCDSKEALTINQLFSDWQPEMFIDTHVSDGADYQYVMTYIPTHPAKLNPILAKYETQAFDPTLEKQMAGVGFEMCPYVTTKGATPDSGIIEFFETPRFSSGYAALRNCIGFITETHMLKPYPTRVKSTYQFILQTVIIMNRDYATIRQNKVQADKDAVQQKDFAIHWQLDSTKYDTIHFKGYTAKYKKSRITDSMRLYYDRSAPYNKTIRYYTTYNADVTITKPVAYIVPLCYDKAIELLKANNVVMKQLKNDTLIDCSYYYLTGYKTSDQPYENHFPHSDVNVTKQQGKIQCYAGDYVVICNQPSNYYIVQALEPQADDSYFVWNFFDGVLMQKEGYSDYIWEDIAIKILDENPELKKQFEEKKKADPFFAAHPDDQLDFLYHNSLYFEKSFNRYPILRLE